MCESMFPNIKIDVCSSQGNAFYIIGIINNILEQIGYKKGERDEVIKDMMSSDYSHLCKIAKKYIVLVNEE